METTSTASREEQIGRHVETALRIGALLLVVYWVFQIVAPFVPLLVWAVILAVAFRPAHLGLSDRLGGRRTLAAALLTLLTLLVLIVPVAWLGVAMVDWGTETAKELRGGTLRIPPPPDRVSTWPVVGPRVHDLWALASTNLSEALRQAPVQQLRGLAEWLLRTAAGMGLGVLHFTLSVLIAGALLAHAEGGADLARRLFRRLAPGADTDYSRLSEQVIRSVATGVIGVAFIQAALIGIGFVAIGVPGAPVWIAVTLLMGIVQLPATLVILPVLIWVWGSQETLPAVLFTAWIVPAGLADNVLKPMLLGRGLEVPMLVIFVGAIGGFAVSGIVGLFTGAVVLTLAHGLFRAWLEDGAERPVETAS